MKKIISRTKIKSRVRKKTNPELVETIREAMKHSQWKEIAKKLSSSTRNYSSLNLSEIDRQAKEGDTIIIIGKVLSKGELTKRIRICARSFSHTAMLKLKEAKSETVTILDEIKKNPKAEGIKIIK